MDCSGTNDVYLAGEQSVSPSSAAALTAYLSVCTSPLRLPHTPE